MIKQIILALIAAMVPLLYSLLIAKFPEFPLTADQLLAVAVWIVGLIFAGTRLQRIAYIYKNARRH